LSKGNWIHFKHSNATVIDFARMRSR